MKPYAYFDRKNFPLVVVDFTGAKETPENFEQYLLELKKNYDYEQSFSLVFDAHQAPVPQISYQKLQAEWMTAHSYLIRKYCLGVAYVMPNTFLRMVLKFIFSLQKSPAPFRVFGNKKAGFEWAKERLSSARPDNNV